MFILQLPNGRPGIDIRFFTARIGGQLAEARRTMAFFSLYTSNQTQTSVYISATNKRSDTMPVTSTLIGKR
jgi:hypothetical protein